MPIAIGASRILHALSIGPALLGMKGRGRVHSVFNSVVNLEIEGFQILAALSGPEGAALPHAIALRESPDFGLLRVDTGMSVEVMESGIAIGGASGFVIRLDKARALRPRPIEGVARGGRAYRACLESLTAFQESRNCEFRLADLVADGAAPWGKAPGEASAEASAEPSPEDRDRGLGTRQGATRRELASRAIDLGRSALSSRQEGLAKAVARLVGLGQGLTPSGDDLLCGFLAAARCAAPEAGREALLRGLGEALEKALPATNAISASMLRCAIQGLFPDALLDLAAALAAEDSQEAASALARVSAMGHSSGADLCGGFLYGIGLLTGALSISGVHAA